MQPMLSVVSPVPGAILLNGRFAGEARPEEPLFFPVSPWGAMYLTLLPLGRDHLPLTARLTLSAGRLLGLDAAEGLYAVSWPGPVTDLELVPRRWEGAPRRQVSVSNGVSCALVEGAETWLEVGSRQLRLPDGARLPEPERREGLLLFTGSAGDERYLAVLPEAEGAPGQLLRGASIDIEGALVHVVAPRRDTVGHARLETWRLADGTIALERAEPGWEHGAPRWPQTAEATALAMLEAWFLGLEAEAENWLAPQLNGRGVLQGLLAGADGCAAMRYALSDGRPTVALLKREAPNLARAVPLYYRAVPAAGSQGPWQIAALEL